MTTITHEVRINAPKEKVWAILADLGGIQTFNPNVSKSYYTSDSKEGVGASRHCDLLPMGAVEEQVIEWRSGESYTIKITEGQKIPPFKHNFGRLSVKEDGRGSIATMHFEYTLKYGFIGALMDRLMVKSQFSKAIPGILVGLKHYAETGEPVDRQVYKRLRQAAAVPA